MGKRPVANTAAENLPPVKKEVLFLKTPLNCLSANKNTRHLAVGGKRFFKIFDCRKQNFEEVANLRSSKYDDNHYLTVNDVNWCKFDEKVLVSASNQGSILIWDVQNGGQIVKEYGLTEVQRTVNSMEFHPDSSSLLLVASQDGLCQTIDLRRREPVLHFAPAIDSPAREHQFDPRHPNVFAVVFENGLGRLWDLRYPREFLMQWIAHGGPATCLDWHPTEDWLITGGRDKTAAVWDMTVRNPSRRLTHMLLAETVASVGRVRWRPGHKYQMVAAPMLTETYISIWDVRRPFVPEGYFMEHKETIGGVLWKDESIFYTCGRDGRLCRFLYEDCYHFREELNPAALSVSIYGNILYSAHEEIGNKNYKRNAQNEHWDQALTMKSITYEISRASEHLSMEPFIYMAENYKLVGSPVVELCHHNARVALNAGQHLIHHTWSMLATMHWNSVPSHVKEGGGDSDAGVSVGGVIVGGVTSKKSSKTDVKTVAFKDLSGDEKESEAGYKKSSTGASQEEEDESESASEEVLLKDNPYFKSSSYVYSTPDIFSLNVYSDDLSDRDDDDLDNESSQVEQDINVFSESDQYRKYSDTASFELQCDDSESPTTEQAPGSRRVEVEEVLKYEILNSVPYVNTIEPFDYIPVIVQMVEYFINENDVQSAVSIILTLGDNSIRSRIDPKMIELWVLSYLDQLSEFGLYMIATDVQNVYQPDIPQMSTTVKVGCSGCLRSLRYGWICAKCQFKDKERPFTVCALCHMPVKGLYMWCQGCSHGGHTDHILKWFSNHTECPTGCGHFCEFS